MRVQPQRGITLIELMIALAIVGIIGAIAYPSYIAFVNQSRRADAMAALQSFAGAMERHFTITSSYCGAGPSSASNCSGTQTGSPDPSVFPSEAPLDGADKFYDLTIASVSQTSFTLMARPKNNQAGDICGDLTIEHTGVRNAAATDCWP